jgi:hypothetical protein
VRAAAAVCRALMPAIVLVLSQLASHNASQCVEWRTYEPPAAVVALSIIALLLLL